MSQPALIPRDPRTIDERTGEPGIEREGLEAWFVAGEDDAAALCDPEGDVPLRWVEGVGWVTE